jgi:chromate reductase
MSDILHILGIPGSLRRDSFNCRALEVATQLTPNKVDLTLFTKLGDIPLFDQDHENQPPAAVRELKQEIRRADAILIATPEYNYSVPGVLKNAIDWASRPYGDNAWEGKPAGIMSASISMLGGARAQYHLRQIMVFLNMHPLNKPEVIIPQAQDKFAADGTITDQHTREKITALLDALVKWTLKLQTGEEIIEELEEEHDYQQAYGRLHN